MGTMKASRPEKESQRFVSGSLPLKKRKFRSNLLVDSQVKVIVSSDSPSDSVNDDDETTSLYTPKTALSDTLRDASPILMASEPPSQFNLPRLVTPLPSGCHWQTTRHKAYCRRQPCYNNSNFCKLHYQLYTNVSKNESLQDSSSDGSLLNNAPLLPNILHQDKRFAEAPGQVRCIATTTRGRPCAYISVNDTKYCYLHSRYENSRPAPRRNSYTAVLNNLAPSSSTLASPLCALPTVSWLNQSVSIAIGPLKDSIGTVEKWGNGWVSVRVPGVGLHNRRSFELLVVNSRDDASIIQARRRQVITDSSFSSDEASQTSSNRSISRSPVPTIILANKSSAPQHVIVSPHTP